MNENNCLLGVKGVVIIVFYNDKSKNLECQRTLFYEL